MRKILLAFTLFAFVGLSANCGMKNCNMKNCKMNQQTEKMCQMKDCKMKNCEMKNCKMKMQTNEDKDVKRCGCGMTVESCKEMMPHCEYRDAAKK